MNKIIELRDISFAYTNNLIFQDVSFSVNEGEFIAIVGENGTGKSTLMKIIIGELSSTSGEVSDMSHNLVQQLLRIFPLLSGRFLH